MLPSPPPTRTDPRRADLFDPVMGLRVWGSNATHVLPPQFEALMIGRDPKCHIRLDDPSVSRLHATIEWRGEHLVIVDRNAKNHIWSAGVAHSILHLVPGTIIQIGQATLIAYSARTEALRAGLRRFLGYEEAAQRTVDEVQRAAVRRDHIALVCPPGGSGVAIARFLHEWTAGDAWPFVAPAKVPGRAGQKALVASAAYGTLALRARALPKDRDVLVEHIASDAYHVRLVLLADESTRLEAAVGDDLRSRLTVARVPALASRRAELRPIIDETVAYHAGRHGIVAPTILRPGDYGQLETHAWPDNYDELDEAIGRLVQVRRYGSNETERRLKLSSGAISKWAKRYGLDVKKNDGKV